MSAQTEPSNVRPDARSINYFRRWGVSFDAALRSPGTQRAWRTLINHHCRAHVLKSVLYYAAYHLEAAQEFEASEAFMRARERILNQVPEVRKTLQELMAATVGGQQVASQLFFLWGVKRKDISLFEGFPKLLERFENILKVLQHPVFRERRVEVASEIADGEALLHIYVKETTGKWFSEETAVLLEAGAESYGLEGGPSYNAEAVNRRFRRWFRNRKNKNSDYAAIRDLVRQLKHSDTFLESFLCARKIQTSLEFGLYRFGMAIAGGQSVRRRMIGDPFELFRRLVVS